MVDISIVILNYKMRRLIETCISSLVADCADSGLSIEITVVDNDSNDGTLEWLAQTYPQVHTMQSGGNVGFARGNNPALRAIEAKYYFVLNPDTQFTEPRTIARLHEWMETHKKIGVIGPRLLSADGNIQNSCHRFPGLFVQILRRTPWGTRPYFKKYIDRFLLADINITEDRPVDWIQGSAMFIRGSALHEVGLLDEQFFMYYEDTDWCRRFWRAGWPVYFVPQISLKHIHGRGSAAVSGMIIPLLKNRLARVHIESWLRYFWKWRGEKPFSLL